MGGNGVDIIFPVQFSLCQRIFNFTYLSVKKIDKFNLLTKVLAQDLKMNIAKKLQDPTGSASISPTILQTRTQMSAVSSL